MAEATNDRAGELPPESDRELVAVANPLTGDVISYPAPEALLAMIRTACADLPVRTALLGNRSDSARAVVRRTAPCPGWAGPESGCRTCVATCARTST